MSRLDTWMPLHISKYLADTMRLTTLQHGAYMLLLMEYWVHGPLPDDDRELAAIAKMERRTWDRDVGPALRRFFKLQDDGLLHQKRADSERERARDLSAKRRQAALQRPSKKDAFPHQTSSNSSAIAQQMPSDSSLKNVDLHDSLSRDLNPLTKEEDSSSLRSEESKSRPLASLAPSNRGLRRRPNPTERPKSRSAEDEAFEEWWLEYPRRVGKGAARKAYASAMSRGVSQADLLMGLRRAVWDPDPKYIPHPSTWLNGGRWEDEPPPPKHTKDEELFEVMGLNKPFDFDFHEQPENDLRLPNGRK